ncbi:MAG: tight adherence protein [Gaiellaceae bacterium]|jgi:tight adherence protein B|nr:tight adherence protein [Gaiellaceae bacterium]
MRWTACPVALAAALAVTGPAAAGVRISGVDTSGYPEVRVTVVAPVGSGRPTLHENGVPVVGLQAANLAGSKSVVLAVDRSQSMAGVSIDDAAAAARAFVAAKSGSDRVQVIGFGHQALALTHFSSSTGDAAAALQRLAVDPIAGTALWDAVALAARGLRHDDRPGHVIVIVTDGRDVSSTTSFEQAVSAAHAARAAVYTIGIAGPDFTPAPLRALAAQTGGSYLQASSTSELVALYASIERSLAGTWQLRYETAARPGDALRLATSVPAAGSMGTVVRLAGIAAPSGQPLPPSSVLPRSAWGSSLAPLVLAAAVGVLGLLAAISLSGTRAGSRLSARLAPHLGPAMRQGKLRRKRESRSVLRALFAATEQAFANVKQFRALQQLLTRADLPLLAAELLYICLATAVVIGLLAAVAGVPPILVLAIMAAGGTVPVLWVLLKARARIKAFDNQLPDLLVTIAASLKAGHSFRHAVQAVVDEGAEPAAKEFRRVITETRLGRPMDDALAEMSERIGSKNLGFVLTAVTIQRQIGGSLAGLFDMVAETVRQRQQFARKIRGLTAMGRMSAYVLAGLPFFIAMAVTLISPEYMRPLWHSPTGHNLIVLALVMLTIGSLILKKIVSFRG